MKKTKEFMLYVFCIASDKAEAEQIALSDINAKLEKFYEFDHSRHCEGMTWCNVYKVKKLPSLKNLQKQLYESGGDRIAHLGTSFE